MITVRPDPRCERIRLDHATRLSRKLALDIAAGVDRYSANPSSWPWSPATIRTALSYILPALSRIAAALQTDLRKKMMRLGMDAFKSEASWAQLIDSIFHHYEGDKRRGAYIGAFHKLIALHRNDFSLQAPSYLKLRGGHTDLSELYRISADFMLAYKALILQFDASGRVDKSGLWLKHQTYSLFAIACEDPKARALLSKHGFDAFARYPKLLDQFEEYRSWQYSSSLFTLLALYNPARWTRRTIEVHGLTADLTRLYSLSEPIYLDLVRFADVINEGLTTERKAQTIRDLLTTVQRGLPAILSALPEQLRTDIKERGLIVFAEDQCKALSQAYKNPALKAALLGPIKEIIDTLFPASKKDMKELLAYQLCFEMEYSSRPIFCDYAPIREISVALYQDMSSFLAELKANLPQRPYSMRTVYHHFTQFKAVMVLLWKELGQEYKFLLGEHGLKAFDSRICNLQKVIFLLLQNAGRASIIATYTAYTYQKSIKWLVTERGISAIDAYPISINRTDKHLKRLNTDDYYSAEQCRELAYHIEALLAEPEIIGERHIVLMLARILLKTGWNLSPTLGLKCEDVTPTATLGSPGAITVVLQKARAGYRSDAYSFKEPISPSIAVRSAAADRLYVRDVLTKDLRASLPENSLYKSYVFLIKRKGKIERLSMAATKVVTELISRRGCSLTFDSKKIRKGGVNHVYRAIQKNSGDYETAARHELKTFEASYLRLDENQSRYTLAKALDVMGKYFAGKEISADFVIITDQSDVLQHTPAGQCSSTGDDTEALRYRAEHRRLLSERGTSARYCADFLSCIWCKFFRSVADPEHVWKLLSYRAYLLQSMESSVLPDDETEDQRIHLAILKTRVAEILRRLDAISPGVVVQGEALLADNGMHPDWSFALTDAPSSTSAL